MHDSGPTRQDLAPNSLHADQPGVGSENTSGRIGILMGCAAVVFWSFGSTLIYFGAREAGTWQFVAVSTLSAGALQLISRQVYRGELRTSMCLPWRLWIPVACFVVYGLVWPWALASSTRSQVGGVNLINYLWPVLTVLLSVWRVPGLRLGRPMAIALGLALAGLMCANVQPIGAMIAERPTGSVLTSRLWLPYALASVAAITWAIYSALLARWRAWAKLYVTSPIGFLAVGAAACVILVNSGAAGRRLSLHGLLLTILYGIGPLAAGYLLWELALARARVQGLGLIAATTPVLSTFLLCCFLKQLPGLDLAVAALLVSGGVVLSMKSD